jgi:hypothetical protein
MQSLEIIGLCVVAAVVYGIVQDQITTRICLEYFTVFHPPILNSTHSPTLLAFGWGIIATWWVGVLLGIPLAIAARAGTRPKLAARDLLPLIRSLLLVMAVCAVLAGIAGFAWGTVPHEVAQLLPPQVHRRFVADWWAHNASYASGFVGGVVLWVLAYRMRRCVARAPSPAT